MESIHIISQDLSLMRALERINQITDNNPLVLFAIDSNSAMRGTLTDGDVRRALIKGVGVDAPIAEVMHRDFNFLRRGVNDGVEDIHHQRELKMRLVPILDEDNHICEIINLERYITKLPIDAVLMAGGKGERLRPLTEKTPKPLIKVGDKCIIDYNIDRLLSYGLNHISFLHFCQHDADMSVAAVPYVVKVPYGVFNLKGREIKGVTEKPTISYYANAGIYLIKRKLFDLIPDDIFFNATDFMDKLIELGHKVIRYPISGYWLDIGQHDELARAREMVKHLK